MTLLELIEGLQLILAENKEYHNLPVKITTEDGKVIYSKLNSVEMLNGPWLVVE